MNSVNTGERMVHIDGFVDDTRRPMQLAMVGIQLPIVTTDAFQMFGTFADTLAGGYVLFDHTLSPRAAVMYQTRVCRQKEEDKITTD